MSPTQHLSDIGQSLWLDDITRELLDSGTLARYIETWSVTGLTSNPTIFDHAITHSKSYDADIMRLLDTGSHGEALFFELAIADLSRAADLFLPVHQRTATVDGWVSLEVSPLLAHDTRGTVASARSLHAKANKRNLFIKIPGTREGLPAIEEAIFSGVPVNVTLLFSPEQYSVAAGAYMKGLERRVEAGLRPMCAPSPRCSSRAGTGPWRRKHQNAQNKLGLAIGRLAYKAYRDVLASDRWQRLEGLGARAQRLLFASTGTKDPHASDLLYIGGLAAPNTVNTMPEATLKAAADHLAVPGVLPRDGGDAPAVLAEFEQAGIGIAALADKLQGEGADAFVQSWQDLLRATEAKSKVLS